MGERLNISLDKGIHRKPTLGQEGELSELVNMIPKNGQLTPISECTVDFSYGSDAWTLLYVHENAGYKHYIHAKSVAAQGGTAAHVELYWTDGEPSGAVTPTEKIDGISISTLADIYRTSHMGHTIILLLSSGIAMFVFKGDDNGYVYLNGSIPEINASFGLKTYLETWDYLTAGVHQIGDMGNPEAQEFSNKDELNSKIIGKRNAAIKSIHEDGYWTFPFFVRYAIVLKDGSLAHCSSPVLMVPSTDNPYIIDGTWEAHGAGQMIIVKAKLDMALIESEINALKEYADIIEGVAIYVSEQFCTYKQDEDYHLAKPLLKVYNGNYYCVNYQGGDSYGKFEESNMSSITLGYERAATVELLYYTRDTYWMDSIDSQKTLCNPVKDIEQEVRNCSNFYLLKEFSLEELPQFYERANIDFTEGRLPIISSFPRMEDLRELRGDFIPQEGYVYNQRLNISRTKISSINPLSHYSLINYITAIQRKTIILKERFGDGIWSYVYNPPTEESSANTHYKQRYQTSIDNIPVVIENSVTMENLSEATFFYIAVPDNHASRLWIYKTSLDSKNIELNLLPHHFIKASYWYGGLNNTVIKHAHEIPELKEYSYIDNKIYLSLPSNPWVFPELLTSVVGNGDIIGMATTAKAMSIGQYGQFPMVIFSSDGIWSMQVNEDGTYKPAVFVSGDVCSNPGSITQTDNAILFVTRQGLKYIVGSEVKLLTAMIEGTNIDDSDFIPDNTDWSSIVVADTADKRKSFQDCKIVYDYVDRLIHVFNSETSGSAGKHECLSLESSEYASEVQIIDDTENTKLPQPRTIIARYPVTLFQVGNDIYSYKGADLTEPSPRLGYLITRPMAFGDYTRFKTVMDLRIYSDIEPVEQPNDTNGTWCILYGSNDKNRWVRLNSCKGMPFKYFRIAIVTRLGNDDTLSGISLEYEERRGNKMK